MLCWNSDRSEILSKIVKTKKYFKIILKTKNDHFFLESYYKWHASIVDFDGLIIFDNCSTDPQVLDFYKKISGETLVIKFDFFHNRIHRLLEMKDFYCALKESCNYYYVSDTDERLVYFDNEANRFETGFDLIFRLRNLNNPIIPTLWVNNVHLKDSQFYMFTNSGTPMFSYSHGKPIISSKIDLTGIINHNFQICAENYDKILLNFITLHFKNLFPEQRMFANKQKLIANKVVSECISDEELAALDEDKLRANNNNPRTWLREFKELFNHQKLYSNDVSLNPRRIITLNDNGCLLTDPDTRSLLRTIFSSPNSYRDNVVGSVK